LIFFLLKKKRKRMASKLFQDALNTGLLGIIFTVAALPKDKLGAMDVNQEEKRVIEQCVRCADHMQSNGVHKNLLNVNNNKKLKVCRNILSTKNHSKTEALLKKFLGRVLSTGEDRAALDRLVTEHVRDTSLIHTPLARPTDWMEVSSGSDYSDNDSVRSNVSDFRTW
jgi:hypothetical protein